MIFTILGILSALVFVIGDYQYFVDTLRGTTKHRVLALYRTGQAPA